MRTRTILIAILIATGLGSGGVSAGEQHDGDAGRQWKHRYWNLHGGSLGAPSSPRLDAGGPAFVLGGGIGTRFRKHLAGEVEALLAFRDYDAPFESPPGTKDTDMDTTTLGVFYNLKLILPVGRFEPYVGAGAGLAYSEASVPTPGLLFTEPYTEHDFGFAGQWLLGADVRVGARTRIGVEWREIHADADFGALTAGSVDIGGESFLFSYRRRF